MKLFRKIIALIISLSLVFTFSLSAFAIDYVAPQTAPSFDNAIFSYLGDIESGRYTEIATLTNGDKITFEHSITLLGNIKIVIHEIDGSINIVEYNTKTQNLFLNNSLVEKTVSRSNNLLLHSNWQVSAPVTQNYLVANFTLGSLAAGIAAFVGGPVGAITGIVSGFFYTTSWMSAVRTIYTNYIDYSPKIGGYYDSDIYAGRNGEGELMGSYTTNIFIR